jgi:hypothetical protein
MVPEPKRPTWPEALAMERSVVPYERLMSMDARLEGAAARPVITPQTIVVDQGNVFVSSSFIAADESLGISVQPTPPGNGPAKGHVERTFSSINTGRMPRARPCGRWLSRPTCCRSTAAVWE